MKLFYERDWVRYLVHRLYRDWVYDVPTSPPVLNVIGDSLRAYGIDISHWEDSFDPDKAQQGLIDFAIFKATEGTTFKDDRFESFYQASVGKVPIIGAYHYLRSGLSPTIQADHFVDVVRSLDFDILVCDFETTNNNMNDAFVGDASVFGDRVKERYPNCKLLFYTNPSTYDNIVYPASLRLYGKDVFKEPPWDGLWIAQYYYTPSPDKEPSMPKSRSDWILWQYSEAGDPAIHGTGGWCDQNVYNGTVEEMHSWLGIETDPTPPPDNGDNYMDEIIYPNGVTVKTGRQYNSDVQVVVIEKSAIQNIQFAYDAGHCHFADEILGDVVMNFTPFDPKTCRVGLGLRLNGSELAPYVNYNPYLAFLSDNTPLITHVAKQWKNYINASQGFRYIIQNGSKNPNYNSDWDDIQPRQLVGVGALSQLVIITVRGREPGVNEGITLHEACTLGIAEGCFMMMDVDSGSSAQTVLRYDDGGQTTFVGVVNAVSPVAVQLAIALKTPLPGDNTTPPPPTPGNLPFILDVDGYKPFSGELEPD